VLEHIGPYRAVLAEIRRVLKPGGALVASVPRYWPEWICWALSDAYHANEGGHVRIFRAAELERDIEALGFRRYRRHWAHALHSPFWWLKCLLWERRDESRLIALYHRLLVWDLMERPRLTRWLEALLNPVMGKSVVMYFEKAAAG
jgi:SAM-dependent methyltransferase